MTRSVYRPPWRIDLDVRVGDPLPATRRVLADAIAHALEAAAAPEPASVGLILIDDREMASLNERHLGKTGPTDVLSFPLLPPDAYPPHPGKAATTSAATFPQPPGRRPHLG